MSYTPETSMFEKVPAFQGCSSITLEKIRKKGQIQHFNLGQVLSTKSIIPDRVLLIISGKCRLIGQNNGKLSSIALMEPGTLVGLTSLLRAESCEEISAATNVEAWSIPDSLIVDIYDTDKFFRNWCNTTVFPSEAASLIDVLINESEKMPYSLLEALNISFDKFRVFSGTEDEKALNNIRDGESVFIASKNSTAILNSQIEKGEELPVNQGPFDLRLLSLPKSVAETIMQGRSQDSNVKEEKEPASKIVSDILPSRSTLALDGKDIKDSIKLINAENDLDESLACLQMVAQIMELPFRSDSLEKSIRGVIERGIKPSLPMFGQLLSGMGLLASGAKVPASFCTRMNVPCLIEWKCGWGVVVKSDANGFLIAHPKLGWVEANPEEVITEAEYGFNVIAISKSNETPRSKFNFSWFFPAIKKYQSTLLIVLSSSFIVQLFTLANPLIIQVIIDKVISQRSLDTLQVLGIALVAVTIFEGILSSLRTFLFTDTTNRIDMRLGAEVIDHLLRLPVGYFDRRPVGELGTRLAELEKIRNFLTGEALTTIIDAAFSIIYILVMALYSWILTVVALIVVPIQVAITLVGAPLFRRQFRKSAEANARSQSHLVEVLTGIQTVKAQNVEIVSRWKWQERYSEYIARTFEKTITATALNQTGQVLQKISQLMVLWVGASMVLDGGLTLGQLIAFRIISGYVTQPLLRLSTIWQRVQELRVSFDRLADIVDTPEESTDVDKEKIPLPPISGKVAFKNLDFRFKPGSPKVLKNINLEIPAGKFVGVVGQSGSGKSTLMKLISRLYSPEEGKIMIDDYDIDKVELYSLRRQIGIVPQEPLLFSGNVNDNIALTDPNASSEEISKAAMIACAHEFIMGLADGYSTQLGERGANLSGGQRQRLAIARTLLANPKLLVMDEATSALDYDTERRVCQNLRESLEGCTVFFVTHRLSTVRNADTIVMMHQGAVVEVGDHDELMKMQGRYYALFRQQEAD